MARKQQNNLVHNAAILMVASIVSRIIGLLYRRPLGEILGSVGLGYYGYASNLYSILLLISSYSIPMAVSKIVSERLAKRQYRSAARLFRGAMLYAVLVGGATALVCYFLGGVLLPQNQQNALPALRALAPTIFLSAILGVLRGYFQAHRTMNPTSLSQILEQIMNAAVSILAAWTLVSRVGGGDAEKQAIYGAMGGTIGTGAGVLTGLLFMFLVFRVNSGYFRRKVRRDPDRSYESYGDILKEMTWLITPIIFTSFILNSSAYLDSYLYSAIQGWHRMAATDIAAAYGEYSNYYVPMVGIPLALASASTSAMMPEVSGAHAVGDIARANGQINQTLRLAMFICIPCMIGFMVLAAPIMHVLFPAATPLAANLLLTGSLFVVTDSFSIITGGVLQAIGRQREALVNAAVSLGVNLASLALMLLVAPQLDIYAVMLSNIVFSVVCCAMNIRSMHRFLGLKHQLRRTYMEPLVASLGMGAAAWLVYTLLFRLMKHAFLPLAAAIVLAVAVYIVLYTLVSGTTEEEMRAYPLGRYLVKFLRLVRIY